MEAHEFNTFFRVTFPKVVRYAQRKVNPAQAEDLAAMAMQAIWTKNVPSPKANVEHRKLQSLAYRIVDGLVRNAWRAETSYRNALRSVEQQPEPKSPDIVEQIINTDAWPSWAEPLSMTDREVLELIVDGYGVSEIAIVLDCKPAAITMRLQRAKKKARELWMQGEVHRDSEL